MQSHKEAWRKAGVPLELDEQLEAARDALDAAFERLNLQQGPPASAGPSAGQQGAQHVSQTRGGAPVEETM